MMNFRKKNQSENPNDFDDSSSVSSGEFTSEKEKNRRPKENSFTQQKLKAINPIFTPRTIIPSMLVLAIIFIPLGVAMLYGSSRVEELIIQYQQCERLASRDYYTEIPEEYVDFSFRTKTTVRPQWKYSLNESESDPVEQGICQVQFEIPNNIGSPVFFFYKLYNFYPNHRRYVKSFSELQLNGDAASLSAIKDAVGQNCQPLSENDDGIKYYPCGLIANSLYNDTYTYPVAVNGSEGLDYEMTKDGIAWSSNQARFKKTKYNPNEVVPPPNWVKMYPDGYTEDNMPDISTWYDFQNWMAPGGLPVFSKLYFRNDTHSMQRGLYEVSVGLHFPVLPYDGKKAIYISTRSVLGGKNSFLGISWVVAGGVCLLLASVFLLVNILVPRKMGDLSKVSWNKEQ